MADKAKHQHQDNQAESDGLKAIAATESFRVPEAIGLGETESGTRPVHRLFDRFKPTDSNALIHGNLWSENYLISSHGKPALIDPATYFGNRESEFGMTTLFGGFNSEFYHAYNDAYPMTEGWEQRVEIYQLYHLLNHLNIFGTSYAPACLQIFRKFH